MRAVFRIDFDSSFFDGLLIRTLFHRCAQCFVDMILFDPTSPSVKSYQLLLPPAAASSCCCCCLLLLLLLPPAAAASSCCCCCLLLLLLPPAAAAASSSSCCCFLLPPPPAAVAASSCCCCRWCKHFAEKENYSLGRLVWRWREIRAGDASRERECLQKAELMKHSSGSGC